MIDDLALRGHEINHPAPPIGGGQMILIDNDRDVLIGASDWRKDGLAIGYWIIDFLFISLYVIKRQELITINPPVIWLLEGISSQII